MSKKELNPNGGDQGPGGHVPGTGTEPREENGNGAETGSDD